MDDTTFAKSGNNVKYTVQIVHLDGNDKGLIKRFSSKNITFGRHSNCDVVLKHAALTVSRVHAKIVLKNGRFILESIGPNGSFVNGKYVEKTQLYSDDVIKFSASGPSVQFQYEKILNPDTLPITASKPPDHHKSKPMYQEFREDNNIKPDKNDAMRTYIFRAPEPSILDNVKSALRKIKRKK